MNRARSVTGPLRRAHPASGATWNVQVVRGKMSSTCLWHACRALALGLLLMLLGSAMATIGYYADTLSVAEEIRGNATVTVKDEARGFHLNNLSYAGPIVMGFGGFIVVAACVMTFEARDSAAKVTPARPQSLPRIPVSSGGAGRRTVAAACVAPARLDTLGVYRLPHALPHHRYRPPPTHARHKESWRLQSQGMRRSLCGSAPELCADISKPPLLASNLCRPLRRYALSVDEPHSHAHVHSASAAESECGSQSSLALDLHGSGAVAGVTLRVRDSSRRRPLARQQRLHDDPMQQGTSTSLSQTPSLDEAGKAKNIEENIENREASPRVQSPLPSTPSSPLETILQIEEEEPDPPDKGFPLSQLPPDSISDKQASTDTPTDSELTEIFVQVIDTTETIENSDK